MKQIRPQARDAIIEAAFQVFGRDPTASLADIAERAGVGRADRRRQARIRYRIRMIAPVVDPHVEPLGHVTVDALCTG